TMLLAFSQCLSAANNVFARFRNVSIVFSMFLGFSGQENLQNIEKRLQAPEKLSGSSRDWLRGDFHPRRSGCSLSSMCRAGGRREHGSRRPGSRKGERMRAVILGSLTLLVATFGTSHAQSLNPAPKVEAAVPSSGNSAETVSTIESRIDGEFKGWEGKTVFKLQNGQIWQQASYGYNVTFADSPKVSIYQSGSEFRMKVEGIDQEIVVQRSGC